MVNFILVPIVVHLITLILPLDESLEIGLILLATAAGAPFLPKLAEVAKGSVALSVGLMVPLMIVTISYLPIVLPLLLSGVEVSPWDIAKSLIIMMLLPLAIGRFVNARYADVAHLYLTIRITTISMLLYLMMCLYKSDEIMP